uniref:Putative isopenicillin-n-synthase n=1 Tax=Haeckelia rubra TaxID=2936821 RepID=A0A0A0RVW6_9METZ|nr:putative isopenicillin-n-synthase [Haeckelia rubra]
MVTYKYGNVLSLLTVLVGFAAVYIHLWHSNGYEHPLSKVAVISYLDLLANDTPTDGRVLHSMQEYGFFYVDNIPEYSADEELFYLKQFYSLPDEEKMKLAVKKHREENSNVYRGYGPLMEVGTQYKEVFNMGPHENQPSSEGDTVLEQLKMISKEPNVWPQTGNETFNKEFKRILKDGLDIRLNIARSVIRSIGRSFGHPELIDRFTEAEFSTLGLRRYPIRETTNEKMNSAFDNVTLSELEHEDSTVTVLATFNNTGLQALYQGKYLDVPPSGNGFIINVGTLIADIVDNGVQAVTHRVKQVDYVRHSIPCFFNPSFDADISKSITGRLTKAGEKYNLFGEWMRDYLPVVEPALLKEKFTQY